MTKILKILKSNYTLIFLFIIILYKNAFINLFANINELTSKVDDKQLAEINILNSENTFLKNELSNLTELELYSNYKYSLTRMSYRDIYNNHELYILGGSDKNYQKNYAVINSKGLIGIISSVEKRQSKVLLLTGIPKLSVRINNSYGTLTGMEDNLFIISNISNYDEINLNDEVYTSSLGSIKENIYIGYVYQIEEGDIEKKVYIKSNVDFNNLNYLYVVGDM